MYGSRDKALAAVGTDVMFACGALNDIEALAQHMPVYQYEFTEQNTPGVLNPFMPMGAFHAAQLRFVFQKGLVGAMYDLPLTFTQQLLADLIGNYLGQFAATGNPNHLFAPTWGSYDALKTNSIKWDSQGVKSFLPATFKSEHHCDVWQGHLF